MMIRINQVGYFAAGRKTGLYAVEGEHRAEHGVEHDATRWHWQLLDAASGAEVAAGLTSPGAFDPISGDTLYFADFSEVTTPGRYQLVIHDLRSTPFRIGNDIYAGLKRDALAYFYRNRSGIELLPKYAGARWARPAGHLSDACVTAFRGIDADGKQWNGCDYMIDGSGGWYDAGDYGKYVVNGGIAVWTLLNLYERLPDAFPDGALNIPERANGVPDILDEVRWELEFLLRMQIPPGKPLAGMAYHKLHDLKWSGVPSLPPTEVDNNSEFRDAEHGRYVYQPTTAATLNLAAVAAQAARIWRGIDPTFAERCVQAARRAFQAACDHPNLLAGRVPGLGGGDYTDPIVADDFYWAAAELLITTHDPSYSDFVRQSPYLVRFPGLEENSLAAMEWNSTAALGTISLLMHGVGLIPAERDLLRSQILLTAQAYLHMRCNVGYGIPLTEAGYVWGSNSLVLNNTIIMALAYDFTQEADYLHAVSQSMDYLLGRNALGKSFIAGYGVDPLAHPHHRFWGNQGDFPPPPPGALAGGPNAKIQDAASEVADLRARPIAKRYLDQIESYATNEVAINWNAPLVWVAAWLDQQYVG
jgi:endoglucanase